MSIYQSSIDDNDSQIIYSSGWVLVTSDGDWTGTMHSTSDTGASARVRFTGSRVAVICTIPTGDGSLSQATFSIDSGSAQYASHRTTPPVQWQKVFWDSGPLPMGNHLLTITNAGNVAYFRMDRIDFDPTDSNAPRTTSSVPVSTTESMQQTSTSRQLSTTTSTSQSQSSSIFTSHPSTQNMTDAAPWILSQTTNPVTSSTAGPGPGRLDNNADSSSTTSSSPPLAGILAGVFGGLFAILLILVLLYWLRRRRKKQNSVAKPPHPFPPTPFSAGFAYSDTGATHGPSRGLNASTGSLVPLRERGPSMRTAPGPLTHSSSLSTSMYTDPLSLSEASNPVEAQEAHPQVQAMLLEESRSRRPPLVAQNRTDGYPESTDDPYRDMPPPPAYSDTR